MTLRAFFSQPPSLLVLVGLAGAAGPRAARGSVGPGLHRSPSTTPRNARQSSRSRGVLRSPSTTSPTEHNFHLHGPGCRRLDDVDDVGAEDVPAHPRRREVHVHLRRPPDPDGDIVHGRDAAAPIRRRRRIRRPSPRQRDAARPHGHRQAVKLTTSAGKAVKTLKAGPAVITVRDRSATRGVQAQRRRCHQLDEAAYVGTVDVERDAEGGHARLRGTPVLAGGKVKVS